MARVLRKGAGKREAWSEKCPFNNVTPVMARVWRKGAGKQGLEREVPLQ